MNQGRYIDELEDAAKTNFCIGVSYYPEKHFESPNINYDLNLLKEKEKNGAHYGVSQMFFDNQKYFDYVKIAREQGVKMPLVPGMKIMTSKRHLNILPSIFHIDIPDELTQRMLAAKTREEEIKVGIDWAYKQSLELLDNGVNFLHYYIMQNTSPFVKLMERLKKRL